ncbi:uncharacterized protein LOC131063741 [Cryptomeria japonica]|uniref:uncharacterized protein LOC131063741 n=1 Tax=Cryptomeria japonica TaxID=3369 RepID=UPI0027D9F502|nr:uncharacterized protein LOC131063741 [Cryptomeria japonica]
MVPEYAEYFLAHPFPRLSCPNEPMPTFGDGKDRPPQRAPKWRRDTAKGRDEGGDRGGGDGDGGDGGDGGGGDGGDGGGHGDGHGGASGSGQQREQRQLPGTVGAGAGSRSGLADTSAGTNCLTDNRERCNYRYG